MKIGEYQIVRLLGKGGMSEVYEAENSRLGSRHAVKLFSYEGDAEDVRVRFETEGRLLAKLNHPGIVKVSDIGIDSASGRPYFVMDIVLDGDGEVKSLADVDSGMLDEETVGAWYDELRESLRYIHSLGVVHRDLKLQNVLVGPDGSVVLTDFGISRIFDPKGGDNTVVDVVNTLVRMRDGRNLVMGSIGYMAPELEMGVAASPQSDWYALGVIVYRLLTGTWYDARSDLLGNLETYDPVWRKILPKLLHSNPQGRECLSYHDERRADGERRELEVEERFLKEKGRGHFARHIARYLGGACVLLCLAVMGVAYHDSKKESALRTVIQEQAEKLDLPDFASACRLPQAASVLLGEDEIADMESDRLSLIDAWVLTHTIFEDLKDGKITVAKARDEIVECVRRAKSETMFLYDGTGGYSENGDRALLVAILENAVRELEKKIH